MKQLAAIFAKYMLTGVGINLLISIHGPHPMTAEAWTTMGAIFLVAAGQLWWIDGAINSKVARAAAAPVDGR